VPDFSAQDVKRLRDATGAGMMDAKRALTDADGDFDQAAVLLRERGEGKISERAGRENAEGAVAIATSDSVAAIVELKCETDFVAKSPEFVALAQELADLVAAKGDDTVAEKQEDVNELNRKLKENIQIGKVVRFEAAPDHILEAYLHAPGGPPAKNAVLLELAGGNQELAHEVAMHISFGRPSVISRDEVPADAVERERELLLAETKNEGKPEQAWPKIVDGKLNGWFKRTPGGALLDQGYARDDKVSVEKFLDGAKVVRFAQVEIGA
jgi:elongation factor Ts